MAPILVTECGPELASGPFLFYNEFMSLVLEVVRDKPVGFWLCDGTSPFTDYSGYNRTSSVSTLTQGIALVSGASKSLVVSNTNVAEFSTPVFQQGKESHPFSLEATVRPVEKTTGTQTQGILSNSGLDGLTIAGTVVSFGTSYLSTGSAVASYDLQKLYNLHLVGVHNKSKNQLYVNGELVAEVDITPEQQEDQYVSTDGKLYSGETAGTRELLINGVGIYSTPLKEESIRRHYMQSRITSSSLDESYGGRNFPVSKVTSDVLFDVTYENEDHWADGQLINATIDNGILASQEVDETFAEGFWRTAVDLYDGDEPNTIHSVVIDWEGEGVVVNASVDDVTWEVVERNHKLGVVPISFDPTDTELYIRVDFPAGIDAWLSSINVVGYRSYSSTYDTFIVNLNRDVDIMDNNVPAHLSDDWGVRLNNGNIRISADNSGEAAVFRSAEIWFRYLDTSTDFRLLDARIGADLTPPVYGINASTTQAWVGDSAGRYLNGTAISGSAQIPRLGEWNVAHLVPGKNMGVGVWINNLYTNSTTGSGRLQIGKVVLYESDLSATQINHIYRSYFGTVSLPVSDNSAIAMSEPTSSVTIYGHDWSINPTG